MKYKKISLTELIIQLQKLERQGHGNDDVFVGDISLREVVVDEYNDVILKG